MGRATRNPTVREVRNRDRPNQVFHIKFIDILFNPS